MNQNNSNNGENIQMEVEVISINDINPSIYNPRKISRNELEKLKSSIKTFGLTDPLIINLKNHNTLIGGHQRHRALKEIMNERGQTDMPMILLKRGDIGFVFTQEMLNVKDVTHEKALNIALNKISGDWNNYKLNYLLMDIEAGGLNINLTGFDDIDYVLEDAPINQVSYNIKKEDKKKKSRKEETSDLMGEWELKVPFYKPKEPPEPYEVDDLYKPYSDEIDVLIDKIQNKDMRDMLYARKAWFAEFNFSNIANYYVFQATPQEKVVFEKLALVLLDKDKLIENGFIKANKELEAFKNEIEDEI